ncbi:MAG: PilZ domain-containing protein [Anaerolineaceae bacterium]
MFDRRRIERVHLIHYLRMFDRDEGSLIGNLVDITGEGVQFISEKPYFKDTKLVVRMDFPEEFMGRNFLEFDLEIKWSIVDENPDLFANGSKLVNITPEEVLTIEALIAMYRD